MKSRDAERKREKRSVYLPPQWHPFPRESRADIPMLSPLSPRVKGSTAAAAAILQKIVHTSVRILSGREIKRGLNSLFLSLSG